MVNEICMAHSGCEARITQLEKSDSELDKRLRAVEMAVWKAAGTSGVITAIVLVMLEKWIK